MVFCASNSCAAYLIFAHRAYSVVISTQNFLIAFARKYHIANFDKSNFFISLISPNERFA